MFGDMIINGQAGYNNHEIVALRVLREVTKINSRLQSLQENDFGLFSWSEILWELALKDKGAQKSWQFVKDFVQAQEQPGPSNQGVSKCVGRQTW